MLPYRRPSLPPLPRCLPNLPVQSKTLTLTPIPRTMMMHRSILKLLLLLLLSLCLLALYLFFPLLIPQHNPNLSLHLSSPPAKAPKIYLYDLLPKFTYGVVGSYVAAWELRANLVAMASTTVLLVIDMQKDFILLGGPVVWPVAKLSSQMSFMQSLLQGAVVF